MKRRQTVILFAAVLAVSGSFADTFGIGSNQFTVDFVNIGNAGNAADGSGYGAVDHDYRMGKYEITIAQFTKAYNVDGRLGDGDEDYFNDTFIAGANAPASLVSWYESAKFCNWLTTGDAYTGAYQFNGSGVLTSVDRVAALTAYGTIYVLPTENEWYKAAYYKPVNDGSYSLYASGFNTVPTKGTANGWNYDHNISPYMWETGFGAGEQNGTYDMMGNALELTESAYDGTLNNMVELRVRRGGHASGPESYLRNTFRVNIDPATEQSGTGFRVVAISVPSPIHFVDRNSVNPVYPYNTWATSAANIQDAVDVAESGDTVLVSNGVYNLTTEISVPSGITIESQNGWEYTTVDGGGVVRCFNLAPSCEISGFTITNGYANGAATPASDGGGVYCADSSSYIINCNIIGNKANDAGGGVFSGFLLNCLVYSNEAVWGGGLDSSAALDCDISDNKALYVGGGAFGSVVYASYIDGNEAVGDTTFGGRGGGLANCTVDSCLITGNKANDEEWTLQNGIGGGLYECIAYNCTVVDNDAYWQGSGAYTGSIYNCIVVDNSSDDLVGVVAESSCSPALADGIDGNISTSPQFVDSLGFDYRLLATSPCINMGNNVYTNVLNDLYGEDRIQDGIVDMGAIEGGYPDPWLSKSHSDFYFKGAVGKGVTNQALSVWNSGSSNLVYSLSTSQSWLLVSPLVAASAGETNLHSVGIDTVGLATGSHTGLITIAASEAANAPQDVHVVIDIVAPVLQHFEWAPISSPQIKDVPFSVEISARDSNGFLVESFTDTVSLEGYVDGIGLSQLDLGSGTNAWQYPLFALYEDARLQIIYTAGELGSACSITSLSLNVESVPGQSLENWTIRLRHTSLNEYSSSPEWESAWTVVHQANATISSTGWIEFGFNAPFEYNGTDNLMVDFSFNNSSWSSGGNCWSTDTGSDRSIYFSTDSLNGDPLVWAGALSPTPNVSTLVPNLRLGLEKGTSVSIQPVVSGTFDSGVWTGMVVVGASAQDLVLLADDGVGHWGVSSQFEVMKQLVTNSVSFGSGINTFMLDFVGVGDSFNTQDSTGYGLVRHPYDIGQYEVTIDQFMKARAADSRIGSGNEDYWNDGIRNAGTNAPATHVNWYEAAKFCNWLTSGDAYTGAYQFDGGGSLIGVSRESALAAYDTVYVLPSEDEWYKAAYFSGTGHSLYAHGSSTPPGMEIDANYGGTGGAYDGPWSVGSGTMEQNGTFDMMGNVWEWCESPWDGWLNTGTLGEGRVFRGGAYTSTDGSSMISTIRNDYDPDNQTHSVGFRVATLRGSDFTLFGSGGNTFAMTFEPIGHVGNTNDATGYGGVDYEFAIGHYEVNAVKFQDARILDSRIGYAGSSGGHPAGSVSWYEAAKFCNWLTSGDAYAGAYEFDGSGSLISVNRLAAIGQYDKVYVLPTEDEWHKAAFFKSDGSGYTLYSTGDSVPVAGVELNYANAIGSTWPVGSGVTENNGTFDMSGNHWEWCESAYDGVLNDLLEERTLRGSRYQSTETNIRSTHRGHNVPDNEAVTYGFRVAQLYLSDFDGDGMADYWESVYFGSLSHAGSSNTDGDLFENLAEFIAGTDPTNSASFFRIGAAEHNGFGYEVYWNSVHGRAYDILWTDNLTNSFQPLELNIPYPQNSYTDTVHAAEGEGFYSIDVKLDN